MSHVKMEFDVCHVKRDFMFVKPNKCDAVIPKGLPQAKKGLMSVIRKGIPHAKKGFDVCHTKRSYSS